MVKREEIPKNELNIIILVSLICSIMIIGSYLLQLVIEPGYYERTGSIILIIDIVLAIFSFLVVFGMIKQKEFKPLYIPTLIWVIILVVFGLYSSIYLIIVFAIIQLIVDFRFYKIIE